MYPDDAGFCPIDGQQLSSATDVPVQPDAEDARVGKVVCRRYHVRRVVADGGTGRVYEALDVFERKHVALKIMHPEVAQDEVSLERFKREFEVSQSFSHPHIVKVSDFQPTEDGSFALVMEFLYGEELRATLKRSSVIPAARLVRMLSQIALALDDAHARRLVHRDLKPDNIFLCQTRDGDLVKILDFGSVKDRAESAKKLTVLGTTIGSPFYMAPEQAQGLDTLDHRADVWALAAIAYECVTGSVPFTGTNGPAILLQILAKEPAPPSSMRQKYSVPPTLDHAIAQGLKKSAPLRTPSAGAFADRVGEAYGLSGNHRDWAYVPEHHLQARIEARMPDLMQVVAASAKTGVSDDFFGEPGSLGVQSHPALPSVAGDPVSERPAGVPPPGLPWGTAVVVGGMALILGVLLVIAVML
jgi:serine/threonine-protein kinase